MSEEKLTGVGPPMSVGELALALQRMGAFEESERLQQTPHGIRIRGEEHILEAAFIDEHLVLKIDETEMRLDVGETGYFLAQMYMWYGND
jgi:hypothetical protein